MMRIPTKGCLIAAAAAVLVTGCSGTGSCRPHTDYVESRPTDPLRAPSGLDVPPAENTSLPVPKGPRQPVTTLPSGRCLMEPPSFYATNPASLEEDRQYAQVIELDTEAFTTEVESLAGGSGTGGGRGALVGASRLTLEVADFLSRWAETWSRRDADAWFGFYASGYYPSGYDSSADWRATQTERFSIPAVTIVVYDTLEVETQPDGEIRAQFVQRFGEEPNTRSVLKAVSLTRGGPEGWSIVDERILDVL
jgi:hypothetical protein